MITMDNILISTSTYSEHSQAPIKLLKNQNILIQKNDYNRKLNKEELIKMAGTCVGIIAGTEKYTIDILSQLPHLKVISRLGIGMDNIDLEAASERNIKVFKTKTTPAPAVAELVLGLMIDICRHISKSNHLLKSGTWQKKIGLLLQRKTLGIIGLGSIGKALVQLSSGFHFKILAFDQQKNNTFANENGVTYCDLESLLKNSDIVSIHLNLSDQIKYLIDKEKIKIMKPDAILINSSRGEIINENALYQALKDNHLAGAGLDVFEHEPYTGLLTELDNVILTPHIGAYTKEIRVKMEMEAAENLIRGLSDD